MKSYFLISKQRLKRKLEEGGFNMYLAILLLLVLFLLGSYLFFAKITFAASIYVLISLFFQSQLSESNRNEFLKNCYPKATYFKIRILENSIIALPFFLVLLFKLAFLEAVILLFSSLFLVFIQSKKPTRVLFPNLFWIQEMEFIIGLRSKFYFLILSYILAFISISVGNANLGIFAFLTVYLVVISFYSKPEEPYFVWIFAKTPKEFLVDKIKKALIYALLLTSPILLSLFLFFPEMLFFILLFFFFAQLVLSVVILAKYTSFPSKNSIAESILLAVSISIPVLLFGLIPYYYTKSVQQLESLLKKPPTP